MRDYPQGWAMQVWRGSAAASGPVPSPAAGCQAGVAGERQRPRRRLNR